MKKITWMQGAFALIAALMLVLPTRAEVAYATDLFGTYKFTATVDVFLDSLGNDYSAFFKEECEVKITRCSYNIYDGEIQGLAGATAAQSINAVDVAANTIKIANPNGNGLWGGGLYMSDPEGVYPFGGNYTNILYTFDPATKTITLPDFTLVTCDHANSAATIAASFTNAKLTLVQSENIDVTDLSGEWHFTAGKGTYDTMEGSTLPTEWDMTLTATDDSKKAYNISLTLGDFAPLALTATFDGVILTIPFKNTYFDAENKIGLVYYVGNQGEISFCMNNENLLALTSGMTIAQDSISPEVKGGYLQWYMNGSAKRQGVETEKVTWEGTYKMKAESVTEIKAIEGFTYPAEFDIVVTYNADYDICLITEFMGCDVKSLNYGGISLKVSDSEPNKAEIATTTAYLKTIVAGESYLTLKDKNADTAPILLTLNTDGTITIDNFTVTYMTYDDGSMNSIHTLAAYYQMTTGGNDLIIKDEYATLCDSVDTVIAELEILGVTTLMNEFVEGYNKIKAAVSTNMISKEEGCELLVKALETVQSYRAEYDALLALVKEAEAEMEKGALEHLSVALDEVKLLIANPANATIDDFKTASENLKDAMATVPIFRIVTRSDVKLTVTNDSAYPWKLDEANQCITNGNNGVKYSTSTASISYKSDYGTELMLDWARSNYSYQSLELYVDGELKANTAFLSYSTQRIYLNAGEHVIAVRDSIGNSTYTDNWSRIKNLSIKEIRPLEENLLTAKSERITFENDDDYPWTWEGEYAQNSNYGHENTTSSFSTTFTVEKPSKFSFELNMSSTNSWSNYHHFFFDINEENYYYREGNGYYNENTGWIKQTVLLKPGKYTIEFLDSIGSYNYNQFSHIRNVELHSDWLEIDLPSAGTLGAEVLYKVEVLGDVELLRVKGTLNAEDWATINNMDNLVGLDLTEARFDAVPDYAFDGQSYLLSVKLPEGMTSIGQYAFRGTQIWKIQIPATVTSIGQYAFASTRLEEITFPENSQLTAIGYSAFRNCASLKEFIMPNSVTALNRSGDYSYTFYQCTSLKKLHFSDALTHIPNRTCYECYRLSDVHWPKGLVSIGYQAFRDVDDLCSLEFPETLTSIGGECFWSSGLTHVKLPAKLTSLGDDAFIHCVALKCIEFPSYIERYYYTLRYCTALDTIVCHAPTPPAVASDILSGGRAKSDVTLIVPAFSAVSYKLDSYWYQYGNIVASEEVQDYWRVAGDLTLTNNRRMGGKPDIDLYYNGRMLVGGDAAFEAGTMNFFISESQPCRLLNNCPTMNVDSVNTYYSVNANTWYFFTPLYDVKVSDVTMSNDASYVIRYYDGAVRASAGTGSSWTDVPKDSVLLAGQGYIFRCNKACVVNIPADRSVHAQLFDFAAKEIALETHETETEANRNWNYVGNPYPSYYDIWYMDFTAPITVWTGSTYAAYSVTDDDFVLRPMQSFFVQKPDGTDSIRFRPEGRQLINTVAHASYAARSAAPRFVFNLEIGTDSVADRTRVVFNATRSMDYELVCDASKFMSMDATVPQIYSLDDKGNRLAINERPMADGHVALGVYVGQAGEYTLSASRMDGKVTLYDALTDSYTDLSETDYTFRAEEAGYIEERFELTLEVRGGATSIDEAEADEVKVSVKNGIISVSGAEGTAVQLYSIDGKQLQSQTISGGNVLFAVPADGVYVVTANGVSQKAVVY